MKQYASALLLLVALLCPFGPQCTFAGNRTCDPRSFGALADGHTKDTRAIQAAIDSCAAAGGGIVRLSPGIFLSAPLFLKTKVTLQIEAGATLQASRDPQDYQRRPDQPDIGRKLLAFINAVEETDFAIVGKGTIDGAGEAWWQRFPEAADRPRLVYFIRCRRILVRGVTLINSPSFHLVPSSCEDVVIEDLNVRAPEKSPNTDGIDPSASRHVRITHCNIDVGDDNVAIKSGRSNPDHPEAAADDILIEDCFFGHGHGLSIGSETNGGVRHVTARRIIFRDTDNGIRIKSPRGRGGEVAFISYSDITMENVKNAVVITAYYPEKTLPPPGKDPGEKATPTTPRFHDVTLRNVRATGGQNAGMIVGLPESPLSRIVLKNVLISSDNGLVIRNAELQMKKVDVTPRKGPPLVVQEKVQMK
jgi:polygalacturonase